MDAPTRTSTTRADMAKSLDATRLWLSNAAHLPVSFRFDGRTIRGIPADWNPRERKRRVGPAVVETTFEGREPTCGLELRVECLAYEDYPVVEWVAWFTNTGTGPTPILDDIRAMDGAVAGTSPKLWHCNGDYYSGDGYTAQETPLRTGAPLSFAPTGGRPCDRAFPYFRLLFEGCGASLAVGWPGQWSATFTASADDVRVAAGQEKVHLRLLPGEAIRTPRMTILSWAGDHSRAANLWRRWYRAHVLPRPLGRPLGPRLVGVGTGEGEEFTGATEENQLQFIERWNEKGIPIDVWWIDAGWYPCWHEKDKQRRWTVTGTWEPDPERFPKGFAPVSRAAARHGADLLVWFEPERVRPGSTIDREHPEWLLTREGQENRLLNLGIPECRQWLTAHVSGVIREGGIGIYRQDFNFEPLAYWRANDKDDRQGMNENLHVQGYLRYWDELLSGNPGLWIDSCASGGRRNDLETLRRSVPLHYTDYGYGNHPVKLAFHHVLFEWMPYFKEFTLSWDRGEPGRYDPSIDSFACHCGMAPMFFPTLEIARDDYDYALLRKMIAIWKRAAELMLRGDYYPLTSIHRSPDQWVARQFDEPERGTGFIQAIRLPGCPRETLVVRPRALSPDSTYVLENPESGAKRELHGKALLEDGFVIALPKREGAIWFYRRA